MKKLIVTAIAVASAASVFAQGTIVFNNFTSLSRTHIYAPLASNSTLSQIGNAATGDLPVGTTSWAGFTLIGGQGVAGQYGASGTFTSLLAANGLGAAESSLQPATSGATTTFRTGTYAGMVASVTPTYAFLAPGSTATTIQIVAWDNSSGLYSTWALAEAAWAKGTIAAGKSPLMNLTAALGGTGTPPNIPATDQSFNLYFQAQIPEPSSFALAGLGAAALLIFRRRK